MSGVLIRFCATVAAVPLAAWLLPGVHAAGSESAWAAGILLGVLYLALRPLVKLLLVPLNCLTFGLVGFFADVGFVYLAARWFTGFALDNLFWAAAVALLVMLLREGAGKLAQA